MEKDENVRDLGFDKFKDAYKEKLLNNPDLSFVVRQIVENDAFDISHRYYWVKNAVKAFTYLDEYLKYNVPDLETFELSSVFYLDGEKYNEGERFLNTLSYYYFNTPCIKVCRFESFLERNPYQLYTDGYPGDLHYLLKKPITVQEAVDSNIGVLSFNANPAGGRGDDLVIEKDMILDGLFIEEDYKAGWTGQVVNVTIHDLRGALERKEASWVDGDKAENHVIAPLPMKRKKYGTLDSKRPWVLEEKDIIAGLTVYNDYDIPNVYNIYYRDKNGTHEEKVPGTSVYSVYYDFMVKKGYFKDELEKNKEKW